MSTALLRPCDKRHYRPTHVALSATNQHVQLQKNVFFSSVSSMFLCAVTEKCFRQIGFMVIGRAGLTSCQHAELAKSSTLFTDF